MKRAEFVLRSREIAEKKEEIMKTLLALSVIACTASIATASPTWTFEPGTDVYVHANYYGNGFEGDQDVWSTDMAWGTVHASEYGTYTTWAEFTVTENSMLMQAQQMNYAEAWVIGSGLQFSVNEDARIEFTLDGLGYNAEVLLADADFQALLYVDSAGTYSFELQAGVLYDLSVYLESVGGEYTLTTMSIDLLPIPAPSALALLGLAGVATRRRRK